LGAQDRLTENGKVMKASAESNSRILMPATLTMDDSQTQYFADAFGASLPLPADLDPNLEEAIRHVLDNPGTLVRPRLVFKVATSYGLDPGPAQDLAIALEYFHTASLLFDDLPCMDDAQERRGVPCAHVVFGQAGAILAALALINRAYALAWSTIAGSPYSRRAQALLYLERRLGVGGLLNGQSLDLHYSRLPHTRQTTERIAQGKTVSLIRLTLVLPAMLGGAHERDLQLLERIALYWGLAYQMVDDLKDVLQNSAQTGKTASRDVLLDRPNVALVIGVQAAVERLTRLIEFGDRTLRCLLQSRPDLEFLRNLRRDLETELVRVTQSARALAEGDRL
jgi:geranylgeranyl pyrophosphate synthase